MKLLYFLTNKLLCRWFEHPTANYLNGMMARLSTLQLPPGVLDSVIKIYVSTLKIDETEFDRPESGFKCFGDFFARRLKKELRPVCQEKNAIVSPCDSVVTAIGTIDSNISTTLKIKNAYHRMGELTAQEKDAVDFAGGRYIVLYLNPGDYHRVHVPREGTIDTIRHIPGARYPMAPWANRFASHSLAKNERVAFEISNPDTGFKYTLLMVAAFGVGYIQTPHFAITPQKRVTEYFVSAQLKRGEELGVFRIGSTVVLLFPKDSFASDSNLKTGSRLKAGQLIGQTIP